MLSAYKSMQMFCRDKHVFVAANTCLSRQNTFFCLFCRDKSFVATNICRDKGYFCRDKHVFDATKHVFCRDKTLDKTFVTTNIILSRHAYFCRDKNYTCGRSRQRQPASRPLHEHNVRNTRCTAHPAHARTSCDVFFCSASHEPRFITLTHG